MTNKKTEHNYKLRKNNLKTIGHFTAGIIHDISNPIANILMLCKIIRTKPSELKEDYLKNIEDSATNCKEIIDMLQNYLNEKSTLNITKLNLFDAIDSALNLCKLHKNSYKIKTTIHTKTSNYFLTSDKTSLIRVFTNIINNAYNAMPKGGNLYIVVDKIIEKNKKNKFKIQFKDTGKGFQEDPSNFFKEFTSDKEENLGLGLNICKQLCDSLNISISLENNEQESGSHCTLYLP